MWNYAPLSFLEVDGKQGGSLVVRTQQMEKAQPVLCNIGLDHTGRLSI
jgi:hypothetical protein